MTTSEKFIGIIGLLLILILSVGCSSGEEGLAGERYEGTSHFISFDLLEIYNESLTEDGNLLLSSPQDEIVITVRNPTDTEVPMLLILFYNYEQIPFEVIGEDFYNTRFFFNLASGRQMNIPISLSNDLEVNDALNALGIGIFEHPEHHVMNNDPTDPSILFPPIVHWGISYGGFDELTLAMPYQALPEQILDGNRMPMITPTSVDFYAEVQEGGAFDGVLFQVPLLRVTPGEVVEFSFSVNIAFFDDIYLDLTHYLFFVLMDWEQVDINGDSYLLFEARYDDMRNDLNDVGTFSITMPQQPGFYEFVPIFIPNPSVLDHRIHQWPLEGTLHFTVEVVAP